MRIKESKKGPSFVTFVNFDNFHTVELMKKIHKLANTFQKF